MKIRPGRMFLVIGTVLLLTLTAVVSYNFITDSRLLADNSEVPGEENTEIVPNNFEGNEDSDDYQTLKYKRKVDPTPTPKPEPTPSPTATPKEKINIELINYTGLNKAGEYVKQLFEEEGHIVSLGNASSISFVETKIIEKNDKKLGNDARKILKAGKVTQLFEAESRFDVTIILGNDYVMP